MSAGGDHSGARPETAETAPIGAPGDKSHQAGVLARYALTPGKPEMLCSPKSAEAIAGPGGQPAIRSRSHIGR